MTLDLDLGASELPLASSNIFRGSQHLPFSFLTECYFLHHGKKKQSTFFLCNKYFNTAFNLSPGLYPNIVRGFKKAKEPRNHLCKGCRKLGGGLQTRWATTVGVKEHDGNFCFSVLGWVLSKGSLSTDSTPCRIPIRGINDHSHGKAFFHLIPYNA